MDRFPPFNGINPNSAWGRAMDPLARIRPPNPAERIWSTPTRTGTNPEMLYPSQVVARQYTQLGTSNVIPDQGHFFGTPHTLRGLASIEQSETTPTRLLKGTLCFSEVESMAFEHREVSIVTFRGGKEQRLPSYLVSADHKTRTFKVANPFTNALGPGDSNARIIIDLNSKSSITVGYVNAFANGFTANLRGVREDSKNVEKTYPFDIEIFNFTKLEDGRRDTLLKGRSMETFKLKNPTHVDGWLAQGNDNYDLRGRGLSYPEQLALAGDIAFAAFERVSKMTKGTRAIPTAIGEMEAYSTQRSVWGKTATVDAHMETSDKKLIFEINVDDPRQVAPGKVPKGPKGPHVGYKIVGKDLKIVGHILVDDVDAYRPQVK